MHLSGRQWILAVGFAALGGAGAMAVIGEPVAPAGAGEEKRSRENSAIEKTKEKGFDGVDFSYDLFGAPPGQSAAKMADEVMTKDIAEKPKVMAKQARLLKDRYRLDCKTHPGVLMTKRKHLAAHFLFHMGQPHEPGRKCLLLADFIPAHLR